MRASGPGGQHVNTTDSAVRAIHRPTGLKAIASDERSQNMNKQLAFARLLILLEEKKQNIKKEHKKGRWLQHKELERGQAKRIFIGPKFKESRG